MSNIRHSPDAIAAPAGPYSHGVEVPTGSRLLYTAGEVGMLPDGSVPNGIEAQAEACWQNIERILASAGMGIADLVKITTYVVGADNLAKAGGVRAKYLGTSRPASATLLVPALVQPGWLIEIEAVAATSP